MSERAVVVPFADLADRAVSGTDAAGEPVLLGARCRACDARWFPYRFVCPTCAAIDPAHESVGSRGALYSFTTVHISSSRETPYTLAYVDLDNRVRVLTTLEALETPTIGVTCRLVVDGDRWWFTPEQGP